MMQSLCICEVSGDIKVMLGDYKGALKDSNEVNVLQPHHFANARSHEATVGGLPRSLKDLNKVDLLQLNNVIILQRQGLVKIFLKDYLGALNNLNKGDVLKPNDALSVQMQDYTLGCSIQGLPEIQPCSRLEWGSCSSTHKCEQIDDHVPFYLFHKFLVPLHSCIFWIDCYS